MRFSEFIEENVDDVLERDPLFNKLVLLRNRYMEHCSESIAKIFQYYKQLTGKTTPSSMFPEDKEWTNEFIKFAKRELSNNLKKRAQLADMEGKVIYKLQTNKLIKIAEKLDAESEIIIGIINEANKYDENTYLWTDIEKKIKQIRLEAPIKVLKENKDNKIVCDAIAEVVRLTEKGCSSEIFKIYDVDKYTYAYYALEFICEEVRAMVLGDKYEKRVGEFKDKVLKLEDKEDYENILSDELFN